ncbi:TonB-dependent receptor plug domain-containing protein [Pseudarcicella hirudinis]|uniref:TonB-dependent receptor n=1 Tax=Pseudarcicella hirudinis TaxID=1079859 RepID=UPI0035E5E88D
MLSLMRYFYVSVFIVITAVSVVAQTRIKGKIYDNSTKEPVVGASVRAAGLPIGTSTNTNGEFVLNSEKAITELLISSVGFQKKEVSFSGDKPLLISLEPSVENLQQVVVTANREASLRTQAPVAISKLSPSLINDSKATNMYEIINKTPGVVMMNYNNEQHGMGIRQPMGTSAYFLYLEDGVPIRPMGVFNHNAIIEMNIFAISSVEIVKGPASSLYGPEAVGGAINLSHRDQLPCQPPESGFSLTIMVTGEFSTVPGLLWANLVFILADMWQNRLIPGNRAVILTRLLLMQELNIKLPIKHV